MPLDRTHRIGAFLVCAALVAAAPALSQELYFNDFDGGETFGAGVGGALSGEVATEPGQGFVGLGPVGGEFAGDLLRNTTVPGAATTLTLTGLPPHASISISFLFAAIDSWDGDLGGGDFFEVNVDGATVFRESFLNSSAAAVQSYAGPALAFRQDLGFGMQRRRRLPRQRVRPLGGARTRAAQRRHADARALRRRPALAGRRRRVVGRRQPARRGARAGAVRTGARRRGAARRVRPPPRGAGARSAALGWGLPRTKETPMPIDPSAVGLEGEPRKRSWTSKDALLYALGVGAGIDELPFTTENTKDTPQRVLPTMAVILGGGGVPFDKIGTFNPALMVHGGRGSSSSARSRPRARSRAPGEITAIWDKGKAAVVELESTSTLSRPASRSSRPRCRSFFRGEGGFGGERGPSADASSCPTRKPDHEVTYETRDDQALPYRLSGDRNPLHSDPSFAKMGGFDRPILHGLCTYGFTGRALLHTLCGSDSEPLQGDGRSLLEARDAGRLAHDLDVGRRQRRALFQTKNQDGDVVLDQGEMTFA